jgi:hypothetical protein
MKHIEKIEKEFEELPHLYCDCSKNCPDRIYSPKDIKSFLRQSHTSFIQDLIQRVEGERKPIYRNATNADAKEIFDRSMGFNSALDTIIKMLKEEIE